MGLGFIGSRVGFRVGLEGIDCREYRRGMYGVYCRGSAPASSLRSTRYQDGLLDPKGTLIYPSQGTNRGLKVLIAHSGSHISRAVVRQALVPV